MRQMSQEGQKCRGTYQDGVPGWRQYWWRIFKHAHWKKREQGFTRVGLMFDLYVWTLLLVFWTLLEIIKTNHSQLQHISLRSWNNLFKGELKPEISLLHMKVLILIKVKSNVFLWYVQCCSEDRKSRRSKTKVLDWVWRCDVKLKVLPTV